ncbi:MAG: hypothetical protein ACK5MY_18915 [Jhaorihella sp.]
MSDVEVDQWQYRISMTPEAGARQIGNFFLRTGPGIETIPVLDQSGKPVGLLLGFPIDLQGKRLLKAPEEFTAACTLGDNPDLFAERVIGSLAGRFIFLVQTGLWSRLYPDSLAQVPCVFDPDMKIAASSGYALLDNDDYWRRFDKDLYNQLDVSREGWFPGGLTAHIGIDRLLPNHYLDLNEWKTARYWPGKKIEIINDPADRVAEIIESVRSQIEIILEGSEKKLAQALTAGRETRALLACSKPYLQHIDFVTVVGPDRHETDTHVAKRISKEMNLSHLTLPRIKADQNQRERFVRRGGHCVGDSNADYHPSVWPLAANHVLLGGLGGEIGRAFFWRASDTPETAISAGGMISRLGLPQVSSLEERLETWLDGLNGQDAFSILDLAYIEHRMGPWYGSQFCCDPTLVRLSPLTSRNIVDILIRLPPDWKRDNRFFAEIIRQAWPELGSYPYNSQGFVRDNYIRLQKIIRNPGLVAKKIRKRFQ